MWDSEFYKTIAWPSLPLVKTSTVVKYDLLAPLALSLLQNCLKYVLLNELKGNNQERNSKLSEADSSALQPNMLPMQNRHPLS